MTSITGTILLIGDGFFILQDAGSGQEIQVNTVCPCRFCPGDRVRVCFDGVMTRSLPPQISAGSVRKCR